MGRHLQTCGITILIGSTLLTGLFRTPRIIEEGIDHEVETSIPSSYSTNHTSSFNTRVHNDLLPNGLSLSASIAPDYAANDDRLHTCQVGEHTIGFVKAPHVIVAGSTKAGTMALYDLLHRQPGLDVGWNTETHFFDHDEYFMAHRNRLDDPETLCLVQQIYSERYFHKKELLKQNRNRAYKPILALEKTDYLGNPLIPGYIRQVLEYIGPKIILVLRHPVERVYSQYKANYERGYEERSLHQVVVDELRDLAKLGITTSPLLTSSDWKTADDAAFALPTTLPPLPPLNYGQRRTHLIQRSLYALLLPAWLQEFELGSSLKILQLEMWQNRTETVLNDVLRFLDQPPNALSSDFVNNRRYTHKKARLHDLSNVRDQEAIDYLQRFFRPYNERLADLLGEEWRGIWDEDL